MPLTEIAENHVDSRSGFTLTEIMPRPPKPEKDNMVNLGLRVPPTYKKYIPTIMEEKDEVYESTITRRLFLRGFAAYLKDGALGTREEKELLREFLREHDDATKEIDVTGNLEEDASSQSKAG